MPETFSSSSVSPREQRPLRIPRYAIIAESESSLARTVPQTANDLQRTCWSNTESIWVTLISRLPSRTFQKHPATVSTSLWDRCVLLAFCLCLVLFSSALAGVGHHTDDHAACTSLQQGAHLNTVGATRAGGERWGSRMDGSDHTGVRVGWDPQRDRAFGANVLFATNHVPGKTGSATTLRDTSPSPTHTPSQGLAPFAKAPFLDSNYYHGRDDFNYKPFFDAAEYDQDGRPFALKIHLETERDDSVPPARGQRKYRSSGLNVNRNGR